MRKLIMSQEKNDLPTSPWRNEFGVILKNKKADGIFLNLFILLIFF